MKIMWVKAGGLVPPDSGGKIRSYNILRQLAKNHEVTLFTFYGAHQDDAHRELNKIVRKVVQIPLDLPRPKGLGELFDYVVRLPSREPYNLTKYCGPVVIERLASLLNEESYDLIVCDFIMAAGAIPWLWPCPKVLFAHNVEAVIWRRHFEVAKNPIWKAISWVEWKRMAAAERRYFPMADHVIAVSENDRQVLSRVVDPRNITVAPTGADTEYFQPVEEPVIPDSLVFTGAMDWLPNEDGIIYFANEILPLIRRQVPDVRLCVVGRNPSNRLQDLASTIPNMQLTGWVEDVRPHVAQGSVYVVPLRIGGGTRLKIFEAMSMAKAVVSTSIGAEGLPVKNGEHLLISDDSASFTENTVRLLKDVQLRNRIGQAARTLVEENYSWTRVARDFAEVLENTVEKRRLSNRS